MPIHVDVSDDSGGVQDAYVFVGARKVYYAPNPEKHGEKMSFELDVPLKPGMNVVTVVARENEDIASRRVVVVRKDGPQGEALPTPRYELLGENWEFSSR